MTQTNMNCVSTHTHTHWRRTSHKHKQEMGRKLKGISMSSEANNHKKKHLKKIKNILILQLNLKHEKWTNRRTKSHNYRVGTLL